MRVFVLVYVHARAHAWVYVRVCFDVRCMHLCRCLLVSGVYEVVVCGVCEVVVFGVYGFNALCVVR